MLWKTCVIMSAFFMVARSEFQQTTQFNQSKNGTCEFEILNPEWVKQRFDQFISVEQAELVFFQIEVNKEFINETKFDNIHENGLLRWIWVSDSKTAILSYPVDLDGLTLQLTKSVERTIHVYVNASFTNISNYTQCFLSLYQTLSDQILHKNKTDWKFCHRYFKGQNWKHVMDFFLGSWLGYDFECFNTFCSDIRCVDIVKKGTVNIAITIFTFLLCLNFPLFYLFLPKRQQISAGHSMHYNRGDSPYSFARLFLHLNENTQGLDRRNGDNKDKDNTFSEWIDILKGNSHIVQPEAKVLTAFFFVLLGQFLFQELYLKRAIADFDKYSDIYDPYYLPFDEILLVPEFKYKVLSILPFTCSFLYLLPVLLVYMSYYGQSKNTLISLNPMGIINFKQNGSSIKYTGYTQFAMKFLTRISFFFKKELWIKTFSVPSFLSKLFTSERDCTSLLKKLRTLLKVFIYPLFFLMTVPLNILLYIVFLLFPMLHFIFHCFLLCPFKYIVQNFDKRKECPLYCIFIFIFVFQYVILLLYFIFALRPYFLFVTLYVFKLIVYCIFVAGPLFSTSQTSYQFWAISLAVLVYILKYTMTFNSNYKQLLNNLLDLKKDIAKENATGDNERIQIPIELFDEIANEFMPIKMQLLILFLKLFFTGIFLYVTFDSINKGGNAGFFTTQIPLIITVVMPALVDSIWSSQSNLDDTKAHEDDIKKKISRYNIKPPETCSVDRKVDERDFFSKHFALICPILYTVKCILESILFCRKESAINHSELDIVNCPSEINCFRKAPQIEDNGAINSSDGATESDPLLNASAKE